MLCSGAPRDAISFSREQIIALSNGQILSLYRDKNDHAADYLTVCDEKTNQEVARYTIGKQKNARETVSQMAVLKNRQLLLMLCNHELQVWDISKAKFEVQKVFTLKDTKIRGVVALSDENHIILEHGDKPMSIWNITDEWQMVSEIQTRDPNTYNEYGDFVKYWVTPNNNRMFFKYNNQITVWDISDKTKPSKLSDFPYKMGEFNLGPHAFTPDSKYMITHYKKGWEKQGYLRIWDISENSPVLVSETDTGMNYNAILVPDNTNEKCFIVESDFHLLNAKKRFSMWNYSDLNMLAIVDRKEVEIKPHPATPCEWFNNKIYKAASALYESQEIQVIKIDDLVQTVEARKNNDKIFKDFMYEEGGIIENLVNIVIDYCGIIPLTQLSSTIKPEAKPEVKQVSSTQILRVFGNATPQPAVVEQKLSPEETFLKDCSKYTKQYIDSFKSKKTHTSIVEEMKLTQAELEQLEAAGCIDSITFEIMNRPVEVNEQVYDLNTVLTFNGKDPKRVEFEACSVAASRKTVTAFEDTTKKIMEARKLEAVKKNSNDNAGAPGGPSFNEMEFTHTPGGP